MNTILYNDRSFKELTMMKRNDIVLALLTSVGGLNACGVGAERIWCGN